MVKRDADRCAHGSPAGGADIQPRDMNGGWRVFQPHRQRVPTACQQYPAIACRAAAGAVEVRQRKRGSSLNKRQPGRYAGRVRLAAVPDRSAGSREDRGGGEIFLPSFILSSPTSKLGGRHSPL